MTSLSGYLNFQYNISKKLERRTLLPQLSSDLATMSTSQSTYIPNSEEMRLVFNKIDRDKDGRISGDELRWLLEATEPTTLVTDVEINAILNMEGTTTTTTTTTDHGHGMSFLTFKDFMDIHKRGVRASEIQRAFRVFDVDGDGRIGDRDLMETMRRLGEEEFGIEECRRMVRNVDRSGVGSVDMEDFMAMMTCNMKLVT